MEPQSWRTCITTIWLDLAMCSFKMLDLYTFPSSGPNCILSNFRLSSGWKTASNCFKLYFSDHQCSGTSYSLFVLLFLWIGLFTPLPNLLLAAFFLLLCWYSLLVKVLILCCYVGYFCICSFYPVWVDLSFSFIFQLTFKPCLWCFFTYSRNLFFV